MAPIAHLDLDAFYASVELLRRPELRGQAGDRLGQRAAGGRHDGVATRRGSSAWARRCRPRARCACARTRSSSRRTSPPTARRREGHGIVRAHVERVEVVGLDEAYLDLDGLVAPRAAMRRLVAEIRAATGLTASVGIGPNKLVAKVASDAEKPAGFVVLSREQACERFADSPPGLVPGHRAEDRRAARAPGDHHARRARRGARGAPRRALRPEPRPRPAPPRAVPRVRGAHAPPPRGVRVARDDLRPRHRRPDRARGPPGARSRASSASAWPSRTAGGARSRIKVRLDDWTTVTRARTVGSADERPGGRRRASRSSCCASTRRRGRCACSASASRRSTTTGQSLRRTGSSPCRCSVAAHANGHRRRSRDPLPPARRGRAAAAHHGHERQPPALGRAVPRAARAATSP